MIHEYRNVKMYDRTYFTLSYVKKQLLLEQGLNLTKVQLMDIAIQRLGEALSRANDKKEQQVQC